MFLIFSKGFEGITSKWILMFFLTISTSTILILSGCAQEEVAPQIIGTARHSPFPEPVIRSKPIYIKPVYNNVPTSWFSPKDCEKGWKAIIIHHSLTNRGNASTFNDYHKNGHKWKGIGYDFVIGNGNGSGDGQVEVTFRWREQIPGAHCGGTPNNWANRDGIGICLVGNFSETAPTFSQMQSLAKLIRFLQRRYSIPTNRIYGHKDTPGFKKGGTGCPGKFPMARLKQML